MLTRPSLSRLAVRVAGIVLLTMPLIAPPAAEAAGTDNKPAVAKAKQTTKKKKVQKRKHATKKRAKKPHKAARVGAAAPQGVPTPRAAVAATTPPAAPRAAGAAPTRMAAVDPAAAAPNAKVVCQRDGKVYLLANCGQLPAALAADAAR